jgi:hypothetical protein
MNNSIIIKKATILLLICMFLTIISCDLSDSEDNKPGITLSDARFNGTFIYYIKYEDSKGIDERYEHTIFTFNGTTKAKWRTVWWNYDSWNRKWNWSGSKKGDAYEHNIAFEINNGMYRLRKWGTNNQFSEWQPYEFLNDNKSLELTNFDYLGTGQWATFQKEDTSLKGVYKIIYEPNGYAAPGGGYSIGLGEYIPNFRYETTQWNDSYSAKYTFTFSHWNTEPNDSGTKYYANNYLFYNGNNITLYAIWNRKLVQSYY